MKYARPNMLNGGAADRALPSPDAPEEEAERAAALAADLERMGPTFVKLGQLLSSRAEFLPPAYIEALSRLQDDVAPFAYEDVAATVYEELGVRMSRAFAEFDARPLAAASLGQVHRATLRDGRQVVVKVQRPGIRSRLAHDMDALAELGGFADAHTEAGRRHEFGLMLEEFRRSLFAELDYRREAHSLATLAENLAGFRRIVIPRPVDDFSSERVLTMDYVRGTKITAVSPVVLVGADGEALAGELFEAYLRMIFVDGFFHADPHPGNVLLTEDNRIALIDMGMVATVAPRMQQHLLQMVLAASDGRSDETADFALAMSEPREGFDENAFRRGVADVVSRHRSSRLHEVQVGNVFLEVNRHAGETGVRVPPELTMLGKTLLNLDGIGRLLAPDFDPNAAVRRHSAKLMNQRMLKSLTPGNVFSGVLEMKDFVDRLPARVNRILDATANNELGVKVDTGIHAAELMVGLQKVANRITVGLVIAAMIIGAAMLMDIPTTFTIAGYPGLAILFFVAAAGFGLVLLFKSLLGDAPFSKKAKHDTQRR